MTCSVCGEEMPCAATIAVSKLGDPKPARYTVRCIMPGCTNMQHARGVCSKHYWRIRQHWYGGRSWDEALAHQTRLEGTARRAS